jgi:hypothetical protein
MTKMTDSLVGAMNVALDEPLPFTAFDPTLEDAGAAARVSGAPILIQTSTRLDGTNACSEH